MVVLSKYLTAALIGFTASSADFIPGDTKIVGGEPATAGRYPWQVGFRSGVSGTASCGGTLITPNVVLTAAHCGRYTNAFMNCLNVFDSDCETATVSQFIPHPDYSQATLANDFQLNVLSSPVETEPIPYLADASYADLEAGQSVTVTGWGTISLGGPVSPDLLEVEVKVTDQEECNAAYRNGILDSMLCASDPGQDACQNDSGGPLFVKCDDTLGDVVVGVVSWGAGCASPSYPGVYARISDQYDWIMETLEELGEADSIVTPPPVTDLCSGEVTRILAPTVEAEPTPSPVCSDFFC